MKSSTKNILTVRFYGNSMLGVAFPIYNGTKTMKTDIKWIGEKIHTFFGKAVHPIAHQTQFVRRASRLDGLTFLKVFVFGFIENPHASLNGLAQVCLDLGVEITPQGLDERINAYSVEFLKTIFTQAIEMFQNSLPDLATIYRYSYRGQYC